MKIEINDNNKPEICEKVLRSLPEWFGIESAILDYIKDVERMPMLVAKVESETVGFLSLNLHNKYTAEIHVMGVLPQFHRKKVGRELIHAAEKYLDNKGFKYLSVKTLSESRPNEEYDRTRNFYYGTGFMPVEEFKTLWGEHNPCLLLIKNVPQHI
ncbi:MAG: GNAT family N-acetyltransferase [Pseudobdellovibrionaceae bacterium]